MGRGGGGRIRGSGDNGAHRSRSHAHARRSTLTTLRSIPTDLFVETPLWKNMFENPVMAQFDHRVLVRRLPCNGWLPPCWRACLAHVLALFLVNPPQGVTTGAAVASLFAFSRTLPLPGRARAAASAMVAMVAVQVRAAILGGCLSASRGPGLTGVFFNLFPTSFLDFAGHLNPHLLCADATCCDAPGSVPRLGWSDTAIAQRWR